MRLEKKLLWLSCLLLIASPVSAFSSYKWFGGAVHRRINENLSACGLSKRAVEYVARGCDSQDNPSGANFSSSVHHAVDNCIPKTFAFIKSTLEESVESAHSCDTKDGREKTLRNVGMALHALQDFYSHSNYLEMLLSSNKPLEPVNWNDPPSSIVTCYYHFEGKAKQEFFESRAAAVKALQRLHPGISFHTKDEYQDRKSEHRSEPEALEYALAPGVSFTHIELNKDSPKTLEGRVLAQKQSKTFHELAVQLACEDTLVLWSTFERMVKQKYGDERGASILKCLKSDRN